MILLPLIDVGLAALVLGVAVWTVTARDSFSAVVGFVVYGLLLSLVWVRLYAPDVALTEAAVGGGVTGVLLLTAGARLGSFSARPEEAAGPLLRAAAALLATSAARLSCSESKAPALMSASTVRLFRRARSTRTQKSNRLLNGPPSWRARTMASMACCPVPLTAPKP